MPKVKSIKNRKSYRPERAEEGFFFLKENCHQCAHQADCAIPHMTLLLGSTNRNYPKEWIYDDNSVPTCTKFEYQGLK